VFAAVPHASYKAMQGGDVAKLVADDGLVADLKGIWRGCLPAAIESWTL